MTTPFSPAHLEQHRQHFPALGNKTYFNYGGQGPMPQSAIAAIREAHETLQRTGPFSGEANGWMLQEITQVRGAIATELHVTPDTITLTENVTTGCNIPLWGFDWQAGDHLVLSDCEHPGIIAAIQELEHRFGIRTSVCSILDTLNGGDPVAAITQHLQPETRLVVISHLLWNTGQVLPLQDIVQACHRTLNQRQQPVRVLVDAAQSAGSLPLDLASLGVDFYAFTGHKWLCGPAGVGALYVSPQALESIRPTFIGWRGITKDEAGMPTGWQAGGTRFEVATCDVTLYPALREAIATHNCWGTAADRYQRITYLSRYLWERLVDIPDLHCLRLAPPEAGLVSFQVKRPEVKHSELVKALERQGFMLRTLLDPDCIRACVHYFTLEDECDRLIAALRQLMGT
ncbi:MAG: aminotransferase class V-fold PLP-dependent enzyme [Synechococcales bacterium]|nr:aminotransferase class V-fold PLP-dependent enzyme [Synechococcales bacterium]